MSEDAKQNITDISVVLSVKTKKTDSMKQRCYYEKPSDADIDQHLEGPNKD